MYLPSHANHFILQQDRAPPHWKLGVRYYLNCELCQRCLGLKGTHDLAISLWPQRFPDLTLCDFFLWGFVINEVYVPPLSTHLEELKTRITDAVNTVIEDMISKVLKEFMYHLDRCRVTYWIILNICIQNSK